MNRIPAFSLILVLILLVSACTAAIPPNPNHNRASGADLHGRLQAAGQPAFVGAYVAKEKGFFEREGLDVTIEHSAGQGEHLQLLTVGKVQVTTQDAAVLLQRRADPGLPLVSIALIGQRGQQAYAALASSGLQTPKDWEGRTVGYKGTPRPTCLPCSKPPVPMRRKFRWSMSASTRVSSPRAK